MTVSVLTIKCFMRTGRIAADIPLYPVRHAIGPDIPLPQNGHFNATVTITFSSFIVCRILYHFYNNKSRTIPTAVVTGANVQDSHLAIPMEQLTETKVPFCYSLMDSAYDAKAIDGFMWNGQIPT
jgi:hypothetical protein